jgi:very-short-patch-repair endonuclease
MKRLCKCGCGSIIKSKRKINGKEVVYILGHARIGKHNSKENNLITSKRMKENNPMKIKEVREKVSIANKGKITWMKGKNHTDLAKNKISLAQKGKHYSPKTEFKKGSIGFIGKHTEETKGKISEANKGRIAWNKGIPFSELTKDKIRKNNIIIWNKPEYKKIARERRAKQITPIKDTSIEIKIQNFLKQLRIEFITHQYISEIKNKYCCDILIPSIKTIIECDGDYFHANPKFYSDDKLNQRQIEQKKRDNLRTKELEEKGYRVIRLWEHEIKIMELNNFNRILHEI